MGGGPKTIKTGDGGWEKSRQAAPHGHDRVLTAAVGPGAGPGEVEPPAPQWAIPAAATGPGAVRGVWPWGGGEGL